MVVASGKSRAVEEVLPSGDVLLGVADGVGLGVVPVNLALVLLDVLGGGVKSVPEARVTRSGVRSLLCELVVEVDDRSSLAASGTARRSGGVEAVRVVRHVDILPWPGHESKGRAPPKRGPLSGGSGLLDVERELLEHEVDPLDLSLVGLELILQVADLLSGKGRLEATLGVEAELALVDLDVVLEELEASGHSERSGGGDVVVVRHVLIIPPQVLLSQGRGWRIVRPPQGARSSPEC